MAPRKNLARYTAVLFASRGDIANIAIQGHRGMGVQTDTFDSHRETAQATI